MNNIQNLLLTDWNLMRIIRLGAGLIIGFQAWQDGSGLMGILAGLFLIQAITNTGCGARGCSIPTKTKNSGTENEVTFTEIQPEKKHENKF